MKNPDCAIVLALVHSSASGQSAIDAPTQFADHGAEKIAYRTIGSGTPLIMANRFRGTLDTWDPLFLDSLAEHYQVIWFDYEGIGYSSGTLSTDLSEVANNAVSVLKALGIKKAAIGGWSYGGLVAQIAALEHPDLFTHGILIGTGPVGKRDIPLEPAFMEAALKPYYDIKDETILFFEPESEASRIAAQESHDRIFQKLDLDKVPRSEELYMRFINGAEALDNDVKGYREQLKKTKIPFLAVCGDHDISFAVESWYRLNRALPTVQLLVFPWSGHGPQHQFPELTAKYIHDFIAHTK